MTIDVLRSLPSDLPIASSEEVGLSAERLQRIGPLIDRYVDAELIPGALTLVARRGRIAHCEVRGFANVEKQIPLRADTIFRIASMTKPITSVALMLLYEQGRFQLSDPIAKWLPAFEKMEVAVRKENGDVELRAAKRAIKVRHVLTHTGGIAGGLGPNAKALAEASRMRGRDEVIGDFVDRLAMVPLDNEPGRVWSYSRSTCIVGRLVELISGQTLAEFFDEHIFGPLGMVDTHFFVPEEKQGRFCVAYTPGDGHRIEPSEPDTLDSYWLSKPGVYFMGSGGLASTAADYFRFADMLLHGGRRPTGPRILGRKTVELMTTNHIGDRFMELGGPGQGFGLGFGVALDRGRSHTMPTEGSYTWGGAFNTHWWNDPAEDLFGLAMTQVRPYDHLNLREDFQTVVTAAIDD
ncbi:MAG: beta-lactamase family protein [Myxococcales bacterium]|nr:beta-lactamase family protein [Myxococcales bacterium]